MKQQMMMIQKMIQHSYADAAKDGPEDDKKMIEEKWFSIHILRLQKMIQLRSMMKMYDAVPKLPMTYRVSPVNCTIVIVVVSTMVEYLPS